MLLSTQAGEVHIDTDPMNVKIRNPLAPLTQLLSNSSLGGSSVGVVPGDVEEVPLLVFPSHISINNINDNYWWVQPLF